MMQFVRLKLIQKFSEFDHSIFAKTPSSTFQNALMKSERYGMLIKLLSWIFEAAITLVISMIMFYTLSKALFVAILVLSVIMLLIFAHLIKRFNTIDDNVMTSWKKLLDVMNRISGGFELIRVMHSHKYEEAEGESKLNANIGYLKEKGDHVSKYIFAFNLFDAIGTLLIIILFILRDDVTVSVVFAATYFLSAIIQSCNALINISDEVSSSWNDVKEVEKFFKFEPKIVNPEDGLIFTGLKDSITFNNVSFAYDTDKNVIKNLNLTIKKGEKIGICGPSGGGKSTIYKLLLRFYDVKKGSILIDGVNIKDLDLSYRKKIGIVSQDTFLFDGTIRDNIVYGNTGYTEERLNSAIKRARLDEFVNTLDDELETQVGDRGIRLSGGQKQRVALARLFMKDVDIIILDEATSALDPESEYWIQKAIDELDDDVTVIAIAHRLTTIKNFDKIVVIDNHEIFESGTHEELLSRKDSKYAGLWKIANEHTL